MQLPLQIVFRNCSGSEMIASRICQQFNKLQQLCDRIIQCQVVVVQIAFQHQKENLYYVQINIVLPNADPIVARNSAQYYAHENPYIAVRDAFDLVRLKLKNYVTVQQTYQVLA